MKKTMIFAAFAALISLASCQKEDVIDNGTAKKASPAFTASIAGSTRTTVNVTDGKVAWETTDEITITDASSASAVYTIESIDATTGKATFVFKEGDAIATAPYTATYGTEPATSQTYSATAGRLYMTAPATEDNSLEFTVQCGLMKLNLTKTGESVKSIAVSSSTATYTLTCNPAQSIASAKDFYIALPAGSYTKIEITNSSDITCTLNSASGLAIAANHIKPVTFGESKLSFVPTKGTAMRTGDVEVNWIQLWKDGPKFAEYNVGAANNKPEDYGEYYSGVKGRDIKENAQAVWGGNWRTPTQAEFEALIANCTYEWTTVNSVAGCMITGKGSYSSNSIFLPAAGRISSDTLGDAGERCYYWSSTKYGNSGAYYLYYSAGLFVQDAAAVTSQQYSVRPVLAEE